MGKLSLANTRSAQKWLCRNTYLSVMKAAKLWNGDNLSHLQRLSRKRTLLTKAQVGPRFVIAEELRRQGPLEMASV
jgi:hypothetical protein